MSTDMHVVGGDLFDPVNPNIDQIRIYDIAHALGNQCRYNGHTSKFYSVAEHCILVSRDVDERYALTALLHDASEAYLGDIISPLKSSRIFAEYREVEARLQSLIYKRFHADTSLGCLSEVHRADSDMYQEEYAALFRNSISVWPIIECLPPAQASLRFLARYYEILELELCRSMTTESKP